MENSCNKCFGHSLCCLIKAKGVKQNIVASAIGVLPSTVSQWCKGKRFPSLENIVKLTLFFDCSFDELLCKDGCILISSYGIP